MQANAMSRRTRSYTPDELRKEQSPPIFKIKSVPRRVWFNILAELDIAVPTEKEEGASLNFDTWQTFLDNYDVNLKVLEKGLVGWENYKDGDNEEMPFSKDNFIYMDDELIADLSREIIGNPKEEEVKNSDPESPLSSGSGTETTANSGTVTPSADQKS